MCLVGLTRVRPEAKDAGAQRTILGSQLRDREATAPPQQGVGLGSRCRGADWPQDQASGLFGLLPPRLNRRQILGYSLEDLLRVIAQFVRVQVLRSGQQRACELLELHQDTFHLSKDEISQTHTATPRPSEGLRGLRLSSIDDVVALLKPFPEHGQLSQQGIAV